NSFLSWMENLRAWCISRQLWWGHRIPAFTCENGHVVVSEEDPRNCPVCGSQKFEQDPDVLDTWFSSQLWPFSVFGWPEATADYKDFYPTDVLVTGYDILFFWVARMIMAGLRFTGREPFSTVHLHGLVRVGGEKMSKTKGNVIDPLEAIQEFGADAVRFTLASAAASGPTVSVERGRMSSSRSFATKLWNAARFTLGQLEGKEAPPEPAGRKLSLPDRWILSRLNAAVASVNRHLENFRFDEAAQSIYAFVWHELCDGYVEMVKPLLADKRGSPLPRETARGVLVRCVGDSLRLLHPFMAFVSEEIWEKLTGRSGKLIGSPFSVQDVCTSGSSAAKIVVALREVVTQVRNFRADRAASPSEPVELWIDPSSPDSSLAGEIERLGPLLSHLARLSGLALSEPPAACARDVVAGLAIG